MLQGRTLPLITRSRRNRQNRPNKHLHRLHVALFTYRSKARVDALRRARCFTLITSLTRSWSLTQIASGTHSLVTFIAIDLLHLSFSASVISQNAQYG